MHVSFLTLFKDAFEVIKAGLTQDGPTVRIKFIPEAMMSIMEEREDRFLKSSECSSESQMLTQY